MVFLLFLITSSVFGAMVPLTLRHAVTADEVTWGLMNCTHLDENEGMTFTLGTPTIPAFWMFNCKMDLSIAYLDQDRVIREIHEMKSYFHKMDNKRVVNSVRDLNLYAHNDPIRSFFAERSTRGKTLTYYALEMNKGFFDKNNIHVNDLVVFEPKKPQGYISKAIDVTPYLNETDFIPFEETCAHTLVIPGTVESIQLTFFDNNKALLSTKILKGNTVCVSPCATFFKIMPGQLTKN